MTTLSPRMFKKVPAWVRIVTPAIIIATWFAIGGFGGPTFGKLSSVSTNDQASFLPASAQSTKAQELQTKFYTSKSLPAIVVFEADTKITPLQYGEYAALAQKIGEIKGIAAPSTQQKTSVVGPIPSEDGRAIELIVPIADTENIEDIVAEIRSVVKEDVPDGQTAYVTGPGGLSADLVKAFGGIDGILLIVALVAVFVILFAVYRSVLLPILVLVNAVFALCGAIVLVYYMAKWGWIKLNGQSQGILSILVIGAATDYSLLLVARYREALEHIEKKWDAIVHAVKVSFEPIVASAATVIAALLCLLASGLNSNRSLGPIAATGIVFSLLATLTFLPAILFTCGRGSFWPVRPKYVGKTIIKDDKDVARLWRGIGAFVAARPRVIWVICIVLLVGASAGALQLRANGVSQTDLILTPSEAVDGQKIVAKHYSSVSATPTTVIVSEKKSNDVLTHLDMIDGVEQAVVYTGESGRPDTAAPAKVVDGRVLINVTLRADKPDSVEAEDTVRTIRTELQKVDASGIVGGTTAIAIDTNDTAQKDLRTIIPIVLGVIFVILVALLRSIVAPFILIVSVVISYVATLGVSAFVFNTVFGFAGADATVPLFGFIFLVALGVDYNIFLMTRVREESILHGTHRGIIRGLGKTGGVITSAGVVLAATFAALGVIPILFLAQIAFIVAFGVLLDTVLVRSLLVPAAAYDLGKIIWWPSKLWHDGKK